MARVYVTISCDNGVIRTFGGNVSDVRGVESEYKNITSKQFLNKHPKFTEEDFKSLKISYNRN